MSVGAAIASVAMALPGRLVSNEQIAAHLDVDSDWIVKRTGTRERPWASDGERLSQFAADAGRAALERAGLDPRELDLVLVATSTADEITPNAAPLVAGLIGADGAGALDVGAACTGWLPAPTSSRASSTFPTAIRRRCSPMVPEPRWSPPPTLRLDASARSCCAPIPPARS